MRILNFGSINIDTVFKVDHIVLPGETIASTAVRRTLGGKGANQSVAVVKAGGHPVHHAGLVGSDGAWIKDRLASHGVDTTWIGNSEALTGQAIIQVTKEGENAIVLDSGANSTFTRSWIDTVLSNFAAGDWVMLQNETNELIHIMDHAHRRGMRICFNPAPFDRTILKLPLEVTDLLVVNEVEAEGLCGKTDPDDALETLTTTYPRTEVVITLGRAGVRHGKGSDVRHRFGTWNVPVVDTTGAGDTFIGCYLGTIARGTPVQEALRRASAAASVMVMRPGAMEAIPSIEECAILESYTLR
jgi:ribokinase